MGTTWLWYAARGTGAVSLLLLSAVVVLGLLTAVRYQVAGWPRFVTSGLHRNLSLLAVTFLTVHIVTAVVDPFTHLGLVAVLVPFESPYRTFWLGLGTVALELLVALMFSSLLRRHIGYKTWKAIHWLSYGCWPVALLHGLGTGTDSFQTWMLVLDGACILAVAAALVLRVTARPAERATLPVSSSDGSGRPVRAVSATR